MDALADTAEQKREIFIGKLTAFGYLDAVVTRYPKTLIFAILDLSTEKKYILLKKMNNAPTLAITTSGRY